MSTGLILTILIIGLLIFGQPLFVIMGSITAFCYVFIKGDEMKVILEDLSFAMDKEVLLAIPLFILAGNFMTQGSIARRLVRIATSLTAPIPSGLAIAGVFSCAVFAAISGSSPVTLIAVGSIMYPALIRAGYTTEFSMGMLSTGGTLGIIIPPSIPMIIYSIMVGVSAKDLFIAGIGPGAVLTFLIMGYSLFVGWKMPRGKWEMKEIITALKEGILSMLMPIIILGGIYTGFFTPTESAAVAVGYALIIEVFIHREMKLHHIPKVLSESAEMLGTLILILILAVSLNKFMTFEEIPLLLVEKLKLLIDNKIAFLIGVNIMLLIVGCFMDVMSAILVLAPLLAPMAREYGVDAIHFGIIMIVNLEIGYLTPPVGINLFVASGIFNQPLGKVIKSVLPLVGIMLFGLMIITWIPKISTFLVGDAKASGLELLKEPSGTTEEQ